MWRVLFLLLFLANPQNGRYCWDSRTTDPTVTYPKKLENPPLLIEALFTVVMLCCRYCREIQISINYPCVKTTYHAVLISEAITHSPASDLELFLTKYTAFSHFWDQDKCLCVYGGILTYRKHSRVIQLFKNPICEWTLGHHFFYQILISADFWRN